MKMPKVSFGESLEKSVVSAGKCVGCAACVVVCPFHCLDYEAQRPKIVKECKICGICPNVCPQYDVSWSALEEFAFGRRSKPQEKFGIYERLVIAQATDKNILQVGQDGGVVSSLLSFALKNGTIDGGAISGTSKGRKSASKKLADIVPDSSSAEKLPSDLAKTILYYWQSDQLATEVGLQRLLEATMTLEPGKTLYPVPRLATTSEEILDCAGTKYFYSPNLLAFWGGVKQNKKSIAFVGTPCQISAIRRIQMVPLKKYASKLGIVIGLMCTESFTYHGLMEKHIQGIMNINPQDIKKINIKGKVLITLKNGETKEVSLSEAKQYARTSCVLCSDFSAELADISVGGLGLTNWSFIILRTPKGVELFEEAEKANVIRTRPVEKEEKALHLLNNLSMKKRKRRQWTLTNH
jgi:coenzyme F420 hydrogenase subunit beta